MRKWVFVALPGLALLVLTGCGDRAASSGLFVEVIAGEGPTAHTPEGEVVHVGERLPLGDTKATLVSQTNANDKYELRIDRSGLPPSIPKTARLVFVAAGRAYRVSGSRNIPGEEVDEVTFLLPSREEADDVACMLGISPQKRTHPGYRLHVEFVPYQKVFGRDEAVLVTLKLLNTGDVVDFIDGPASRAFSFVARRDGEAVPGIGESVDSNGIYGTVVLRPGRIFTKTVDLRKRFNMQPGSYSVEGKYRLDFVDPKWRENIWLDFATARFELRVEE